MELHTASLIVFANSAEPLSAAVLARLESLSSFFPPDFGFGSVDSGNHENRQFCADLEICVSPTARFYYRSGEMAEQQWVGAEEILALATRSNVASQFNEMLKVAT